MKGWENLNFTDTCQNKSTGYVVLPYINVDLKCNIQLYKFEED